MTIREFIRVAVAAVLLGTALGAPTAFAACADPRGNAYCPNNGLVNVPNPAPTTPAQTAPQPPATSAPGTAPDASQNFANGAITVDPAAAPAGDTVTVTVTGLPAGTGFVVNLGELQTATGLPFGAKSMQPANGGDVRAGPDGTFSGSFVIPAVPDQIAPRASVCAAVLGRASYCTPFSLSSAGLAPENGATPDNIVGHYQCSAMLRVGFGSGFCSGTESLLVLNGDGTYTWGDETGTYSFDGASFAISFSDTLGSGDILNRRLIANAVVDGQQTRYTYIRMDY